MNSNQSIFNLIHTNKNINKLLPLPSPSPSSHPKINNPTHPPNNLHIASLNVRGINDDTKFKCLLNYISIQKYSIFGLSETKLKKSIKKYLPNNNLTIHWSSTENSQAGVALIFDSSLFKYHLKTESFEGYVISSYFNFKPSTTLCVTQIYLPHNPSLKKQVINYIKQTISFNLNNNNPHIIMGDFNSVPNPILDKLHNNNPSPTNSLYKNLTNYTDSFRYLHPSSSAYTHSSPTQQSRIDQLWISNNLTNFLTQSHIIKTNPEFQSDHKIISVTLQAFYTTDQPNKTPSFFVKYNPYHLNQEGWNLIKSLFETQLSTLIQSYTHTSSQSSNPTQDLWDSFETIFNSTILPKIPQTKIKNKHKNFFNKNGTLLHKQLLKINSSICSIKKQKNKSLLNNSLIPHLQKNNLPFQTLKETIHSLKKLNKLTLIQLKIENQILTQETIQKSIQKNIDNLSEKPKFLIQNILQHKKPQASLLKIVDLSKNQVISNPDEIHQILSNYYSSLFKHTSIPSSLPPIWEKEYKPINNIKEEWYSNLLDPISNTEIQSTINSLPNNKAPGPSLISYDIIKLLLSPTLLQFLSILFNSIILTKSIPIQWKNHNIFPISKNNEWKFNISETRPIALLDSYRKIFTKILTNRLTSIFTKHKILHGNNYAGLPNQSTFQPIQILNSLYNISKQNQEELWILSLDIKAAFDSVNIPMLSKSMKRLKIPLDFIEISQNILTNRTCQILTPHGPTNPISIQDGIPQGETISPLWWIIFYDPLLTKLSNQKNKPHNLTNNLAYMDDLNILSTNQQNTQHLLDITSEFLSINNISIHPKKTKLIILNPPKHSPLNSNISPNLILNSFHPSSLTSLSQSQILPINKKDSIRILGIHLSQNSILKPGREKIKENISLITTALKSKYTTGPISSYIYNKVLLPRIEYHLQSTYLTPNQTQTFQRIINSTLKHKFSIEQTLSNKWFFNPILFNIKPILNLQQEILISNLQYKLSDPIIKPYINLELISLQKSNCIPICILQNPSLLFTSSTNAYSIKLAKLSNISFCIPQICTHNLLPSPLYTPLYTFYTPSQLKNFAPQLQKRNLLYIEQLTSINNNTLIKWQHLSHITGKIQRGKTPNWYKSLLKHPSLTSGNPKLLPTKKENTWLLNPTTISFLEKNKRSLTTLIS
jgi:exonuclease III